MAEQGRELERAGESGGIMVSLNMMFIGGV